MVLIVYALSQYLNVYAQLSSGDIGLALSLALSYYPYFVYANSKGSGKAVQTHRLVR